MHLPYYPHPAMHVGWKGGVVKGFRIALAVAAFAASTQSARADDADCDKNHFILGSPDCPPPLEKAIAFPSAITTDAQGNVYFSGLHVVYRLDTNGVLTRIAGNGTPGFAGDGGRATAALLDIPFDKYPEMLRDPMDWSPLVGGLTVDAAGSLYIADAYNDRIRRIDPSGIITTVMGGDAAKRTADGRLSLPQGVAVDGAGTVYVTTAWGDLWSIPPEGNATRLSAYGCGPDWKGPGLCVPEQIAIDASGKLYVPDAYCRVRTWTSGVIVTIAGDEREDLRHGGAYTCGYAGDGGPALGAALTTPYAVAVDGQGNLYIADTWNNCIRVVDASGTIATFAGQCGRHSGGYSGDEGPATLAQLNMPYGVAVDAAQNVYIADTLNFLIRKVTPDGIITTVAGTGSPWQDGR
jgi:sugar lactone lactonase YvrE